MWLALFAIVTMSAAVFAVLALRPLPEGVPVVVAKNDLLPQEPIPRSAVRAVAVPPEASPEGALAIPEDTVGQVPALPIPAGTVLTETLVGLGEDSARIPPGYAQVVLAVSPTTAFVAPGDQIEVWGRASTCVEDSCALTRLAQNVEVISVTESDRGGFASEGLVSIALILPATQVGSVLQSAESENIHFVLR